MHVPLHFIFVTDTFCVRFRVHVMFLFVCNELNILAMHNARDFSTYRISEE